MTPENNKEIVKELKKKLFYDPDNGFDRISKEDRDAAFASSRDYISFLNRCKTESECVDFAVNTADKLGFRPYMRGMRINPGDKIYAVNRAKSVILAVIGKQKLSEGANLIGAHIDAPRIDMRTIPLYEDSGICLFKTHYYGGIKKYQWTSLPLELRGVIVKKDGVRIPVAIGEKASDPVFTITDLLPHLAAEQMKKTARRGNHGRKLKRHRWDDSLRFRQGGFGPHQARGHGVPV